MSAYNFQRRFRGKVKTGKKRCTIRAQRKNGYLPKVGELIDLYVGMRTKECERLRRVKVIRVTPILINTFLNGVHKPDLDGIILGGWVMSRLAIRDIAKRDGFESVEEFAAFFHEQYGSTARLHLIEW